MEIKLKKIKYGYEITINPITKTECDFIRGWDFYIEKYIDKEGNLKLLI